MLPMLRRQLQTAPDAIVEIDRGGRILWANAGLLAMFGYRLEELMGQPLEALVPQRLGASHAAHRSVFFDNPMARTMGKGLDLRGRRKDGSELVVDVGLSPLSAGDDMTVMAVVRELT